MNVEKNMVNPVRRPKNDDTVLVTCKYCCGSYSKKLLRRHVITCLKSEGKVSSKNCLQESQTFMASVTMKNTDFFKKMRLYVYKEVFNIMQPDDISQVAKNDPLIILFGEALVNRHRRIQIGYFK